MVKEGSIIVSDEWHSYTGLQNPYKHVVVNHSHGEYVRGCVSYKYNGRVLEHIKKGYYWHIPSS